MLLVLIGFTIIIIIIIIITIIILLYLYINTETTIFTRRHSTAGDNKLGNSFEKHMLLI